MSTPTLSVSLTLSTSYQQLSALLEDAYPNILNNGVIDSPGFFRNLDGAIACYVAAGYEESPSTSVGLLDPLGSVDYISGMNANQVWLKSASGAPVVDFWIGASAGPAPTVTGVIGTITATTNTLTKASSGNLVDSSIVDDGSAVTVGEPLVVTGKLSQAVDDGGGLGDATHNFSDGFWASGATQNYANGNVVLTHSSGILTMGTGDFRVTTAGTNAASVVTVGGTQTLTAKTFVAPVLGTPASGNLSNCTALSLTAGVSGTLPVANGGTGVTASTGTVAVVLSTSPTLVTPILGVAAGTSLAVTGLITSSGTAGIGYATGAGSTVAQGTSRTTTVVLSKMCGTITLFSDAGSSTPFTFTVTNTLVVATDTIIINQKSGTDAYSAVISAVGAGSFNVTVTDLTGTTTEAPAFSFSVIKAVAA